MYFAENDLDCNEGIHTKYSVVRYANATTYQPCFGKEFTSPIFALIRVQDPISENGSLFSKDDPLSRLSWHLLVLDTLENRF